MASTNNKPKPNTKILNLPEDYRRSNIIKATNSGEPNAKYDTLTISVGSILFRGDHTEKHAPSGRYPVFFADKQSATIYTRGAPEKLSSYKINSEPRLFHLSYKNLANLMEDPRLSEEESAALDAYLNVTQDKDGNIIPYIIPVAFIKGKANVEAKLYLNRRILNLVCRLGFDGWIALPDEIIQRNTISINAKGKPTYRLNPYNPEIAICHWNTFLEIRA
jgi:hypothetical protein